MVQILSQRLGTIHLDETAILHFPAGMPGFEDLNRFALVERPSTAPIVFLQSIDAPEVCFLAAPVKSIDPSYQLALTAEDRTCIGLESEEDVVCLAILSPTDDGRFTANLLAPVVIARTTRRAVQAVRVDSLYSHQHLLAPEETPCS